MFGVENYAEAIVKYGEGFHVSQLGNAALFGGAMVLIGMATIFAVLCLLWGCLAIFKLVFHDLPAKRAEKVVAEAAPTVVVEQTTSNDDEIIAVIAAAIAMAESEASGTKFRVVSFKRK
jgi:sodium pump decarboxylase gamma subunit